ncbi:riboflavin synthase [Lawsonibacter sp. LCP25S3_F5]|jgi:riboflavin synthase
MFTGIIEELGTVERVTRGRVSAVIAIRAEHILSDLKIGDSVAVNGVCLTATGLTGHGFTADVMHETLDRSALAGLGPGSRVNLERAMAANGRFGGHIVAGHVDGVGTIAAIEQDDNAIWFTITAPAQVLRYVVEKGSIAIDGISLTVARVETDRFAVSVIPHTAAVTLLGQRRTGDRVNLESDLVGKYVERLLRPAPEEKGQSRLTMEFLTQHGF